MLKGRPRGTEVGQLAAIVWVLDAARGHVLLVDHRQHGWSCPGGHVETREEPPAAAARKLSEETGLSLTPDRLDPVTVSLVERRRRPRTDARPLDPRLPVHRGPESAGGKRGDPIVWHRVDALPSGCVDDLAPLLSALLADREIFLGAGT